RSGCGKSAAHAGPSIVPSISNGGRPMVNLEMGKGIALRQHARIDDLAEGIPEGNEEGASKALATPSHGKLLSGDFWRRVPAFGGVRKEEFFDHRWQMRNTITRVSQLLGALKGLVGEAFRQDAEEGFRIAPMAVRVSPYMLSLIDW